MLSSNDGYFRSATFYLGLKLVVFTCSGILTQYLLTHHLTKSGFGLYTWVNTIIALLGPIGLPGISVSITTAIAKEYDRNFKKGTYLELLGGTAGGLVLLAIAGYYQFVTHLPTEALLFLAAGVLGPGLWLDTHQCYWNGKANFRTLFWWTVPVRLGQLAGMFLVFRFSANPVSAFFSQAFIQVLGNIAAVITILKSKQLNDNYSDELHKYGWLSNHLYFIGTVSANIDKLIVGVLFSFDQLAVYAVGELIYNYFYKTPRTILEQISLPKLARMSVAAAARWIINRQILIVVLMCLLLSITYIMLEPVYTIIFSDKYLDSVFYAKLYLINIFVSTPLYFVGSFIKSHGMSKETKIIQGILSISPLILILPFTMIWDLQGVVFTRIVQNTLASIYCYIMLRKYV